MSHLEYKRIHGETQAGPSAMSGRSIWYRRLRYGRSHALASILATSVPNSISFALVFESFVPHTECVGRVTFVNDAGLGGGVEAVVAADARRVVATR